MKNKKKFEGEKIVSIFCFVEASNKRKQFTNRTFNKSA